MDDANSQQYIDRLDRYNKSRQWCETRDIVLDLLEDNDRVLDYGSGTGALLQSIAEKGDGAHMYAVDSSWMLRNEVRRRVPQAMVVEPEKMSVIGRVDVVTCISALGHVYAPTSTVLKLFLALRPGGKLVVMIPSLAYQKVMKPISLLRGYKDDQTLLRMWSVGQMLALLESQGFRVDKVIPVGKRFFGAPEANVFVAEKPYAFR